MIKQIIENVHTCRLHIMKRNSSIWTTLDTLRGEENKIDEFIRSNEYLSRFPIHLFHFVKSILPIPRIPGNHVGHEMSFWRKWHKSTSTQVVSWISGEYFNTFEAFSYTEEKAVSKPLNSFNWSWAENVLTNRFQNPQRDRGPSSFRIYSGRCHLQWNVERLLCSARNRLLPTYTPVSHLDSICSRNRSDPVASKDRAYNEGSPARRTCRRRLSRTSPHRQNDACKRIWMLLLSCSTNSLGLLPLAMAPRQESRLEFQGTLLAYGTKRGVIHFGIE